MARAATYMRVAAGARGLLSGQNLATYSEDLNNGAWAKSSCAITTGAAAPPSGVLSADKLLGTAAGSYLYASKSVGGLKVGTRYTYSAYVQYGNCQYVFFSCPNDTSTPIFDVQNGVFGTVPAGIESYSAVSVGGGWYRVRFTFVAATTTGTHSVGLSKTSGAISFGGTALGTEYAFFCGLQVVIANWAGPYVKTTASAIDARLRNIATNRVTP